MFNFFSKSQTAFGLDVSGTSLKAMQLSKKDNGFTMEAFTEIQLTKGVMTGDVISDPKALSSLIKDSLIKPKFGNFTTDAVVASLPESKSFIRVIQIPLMSEAEAENAVPFEAESFIPLPLDQVYLDWEFLGKTADKLNVLIIAAPREYVDNYVSILENAGLRPAALEVESQSLQRALIEPGKTGSTLLVDLDAFRSSLIMIEDGNLQFTSSIPVAGNSITEAVAKALGISSVKAEAVKNEIGIANTAEYPNIKSALVPVLTSLSEEIKNILKFYTSHSNRQVNQVLLTGGSAKLKNLVDYLRPELSDTPGLQVELANPYANMTALGVFPLEQFDALSFTTAIGLAMRGTIDEL